MFFARLFGGRKPSVKRPAAANLFRPQLGVLEDRVVPAAPFLPRLGVLTGPATHLEVVTPTSVQAGQPFKVIVAAETATNRVATGYTGTIHLSLTTDDTGATIPVDYTFTARDRGVHVFYVTLATTGPQTITATDTTTASITDSATTTVNPAPVATQIVVRMQEHVVAGVATSIEVVALDASGRKMPSFTGTVTFTSTDAAATLPESYTFTAADKGRHVFQVTLSTVGSQTLTVSDGTLTGTAAPVVDAVGTVARFAFLPRGPLVAGSAATLELVALDANNKVVTGYTGTVTITSTDSAATLPDATTFTAADAGRKTISVTLPTAGRTTLTVTDGTTTSSVLVNVLTWAPGRRFRPHGRR